RLIFRFKDGSLHDETVVFSQKKIFRLGKYNLIQKGPAFKYPMEVSIDGRSGQVNVHYTDHDNEKDANERLQLPPDVSNGLIFTLLKNVQPADGPINLSMVAATPKPRLVRLAITPQGEDSFAIGDSGRKVTHYVVKLEIGGLEGVIVPIIGKKPPNV